MQFSKHDQPSGSADAPRRFDPAKYLRRLKGSDYLEVKWRLVWLRLDHPDALIETALHTLDLERAVAVYHARVTIPGGGTATGWGMEERADFGDFLEKAETKALGRALAALGYGTQFTDDFDFAGADPERVVDAPVVRTAPPAPPLAPRPASGPVTAPAAPPSGAALLASEPQVKALYAIAKGAHEMTSDDVLAEVAARYGVDDPARLTRRQASEMIDALKGSDFARSSRIPPLVQAAQAAGGTVSGRVRVERTEEKVEDVTVLLVDGVRAVEAIHPQRGPFWMAVEPCPQHGSRLVARIEDGGLTPWAHTLPSGGRCQMPGDWAG